MTGNYRMAVVALAAALTSMLGSPPALALSEGVTAQGLAFISGGVGQDERETMSVRRNQFSLHVTAAARRSGAYLGDVRVRIVDAAGKIVLETTMDGPWLLVGLALGEYRVEASHGEQALTKTTKIHASDLHEVFFYFDVPVDVLPAGQSR
jgi:hypothetical protein